MGIKTPIYKSVVRPYSPISYEHLQNHNKGQTTTFLGDQLNNLLFFTMQVSSYQFVIKWTTFVGFAALFENLSISQTHHHNNIVSEDFPFNW